MARNKKRNNALTMLVIPHSNTTVKSIRIPMWLINSLAFIGIISILIVIYLSISYGNYLVTLKENKILREENTIQSVKINNLKKETTEINSKLNDILETDKKIREMVGLTK